MTNIRRRALDAIKGWPRADRGWPRYLPGGRIRTSTAGLVAAFVALSWLLQTYEPPPPAPVPTQQMVPPGFVPDPEYTWVPRTSVREYPTTTVPRTTTPTTTTTTTTTPTTTEPPTTTSEPTTTTPTTTDAPPGLFNPFNPFQPSPTPEPPPSPPGFEPTVPPVNP